MQLTASLAAMALLLFSFVLARNAGQELTVHRAEMGRTGDVEAERSKLHFALLDL